MMSKEGWTEEMHKIYDSLRKLVEMLAATGLSRKDREAILKSIRPKPE